MTAPLEVIRGVALAADLDPAGRRPMIAVLDAFRTHLGTEHVKHFIATVPELCASDTTTALIQLDEIVLDHH